MKRTILLAATIAALAAGTTRAADIYGGAPYAATPAAYIAQNNWTGPYIGANIGYQIGKTSLFSLEPSGLAGGVQGGYNWQFGQIVVGGEADFQVSGAEETFAAYKFSNPWFGTARARLGFAVNNILAYATAGLAYGKGQLDYLGFTEENTHGGWAAGVGTRSRSHPESERAGGVPVCRSLRDELRLHQYEHRHRVRASCASA